MMQHESKVQAKPVDQNDCNIVKPEVFNEISESLGQTCMIEAFNRNKLATTCPIQFANDEFLQQISVEK